MFPASIRHHETERDGGGQSFSLSADMGAEAAGAAPVDTGVLLEHRWEFALGMVDDSVFCVPSARYRPWWSAPGSSVAIAMNR